MNVLGHGNKGVKFEFRFASVSVEGLQEKARMVLDDKQPPALPSREGDEVSSG